MKIRITVKLITGIFLLFCSSVVIAQPSLLDPTFGNAGISLAQINYPARQVLIIDQYGQSQKAIVMSFNNTGYNIDTRQLARGVYHLILYGSFGIRQQQFIKL